MAEETTATSNGGDIQALDLGALRKVLLSNSTKHRTSELNQLNDKLVSQGGVGSQLPSVLSILFDTYPLYVDTRSRQAVEQCLSSIASSPDNKKVTSAFAALVQQEAAKASIAPGSAFVLVRWSSQLMQDSASDKALWEAFGKDSVTTLTNALNILLASSPKDSTRATAVRVSRRAFRAVFRSSFGDEAINECVDKLSAKAASPTPKNAVTLGIVAGVSKRIPERSATLEARKQDFIAFYLREMLGSKVVLPQYLATSLKDFFGSYLTLDDLRKDIVPPIEKSLLRAPEVVLNDLVAPLFASLSADCDLSEVLLSNLLKPLLANIKSSNATVRNGAVHTFSVIANRCANEQLVEKVADEVLNPLKTNKVPAADQKVIHSQMLSALKASPALATKVPQGLVAVAGKETNELAASAEMNAIVKFTVHALQTDLSVDKTVVDAFSKGIAEKRMPLRRTWTLGLATIVWSLTDEELSKTNTIAFFDPCASKLIDSFNEVLANPSQASQNGQVSVACAATALCVSRAPLMSGLQNSGAIKKASVAEKALALEPKPSFLLNARIYSKMTAEEDLIWFVRSLAAALPNLPTAEDAIKIRNAWAQALLYVFCAPGLPPKVKTEATTALQKLYAANPAFTSQVVIDGVWQWCEDVECEAKESAAIIAKTGREELFKAVRVICLDPDSAARVGATIDKEVIEAQMTKLLVLCRPELLPRTSWIELCLKTGTDPGRLASKAPEECLAKVLAVTENAKQRSLPAFQAAAFGAMAELAFVAPDVMTPLIVDQISRDLESSQLYDIGPTEAAIYRTPEGTAFVDVLSKQQNSQVISKNSKDYDTLKWEEELRASLASKKGTAKKLTPEEQAKVNAQLAKESEIRKNVADIDVRLRRGIGIIHALAVGPPTAAEAWFGPAVKLLFEAIQAGAGLVLGDAAALGYMSCAERTSNRLGPLRPFVGVATLRAAGVTILPENLLAEPLGDLVTRLLYRLRSLGEQRPFDTVTLSYIFSFIFLVLESGGIDRKEAEDADEQIVLATEFVSYHTDACNAPILPREKLLNVLIDSMQTYTQHFRAFKDCFTDLARSIAPNISTPETDTAVKGAIVPDPSVRNAVLQAISAELDLTDREFYEEIWLARYDDVVEHRDIANEIWEENELKVMTDSAAKVLPYLESKDGQLRRAAARAIAGAVKEQPSSFETILNSLQETYLERAKPRKPELDRYGMPIKKDLSDPWEARHGISLALKELAASFPEQHLVPFVHFMVESGPLCDASAAVRDSMVDAAVSVVTAQGKSLVEPLMKLCESTLEGSSSSQAQDLVNEAVVIMYGALAQHLPQGDARTPKVVQRLLSTLSTPSESVQYAVAHCLPPLVRACSDQATSFLKQMVDETLHAKKYAARRGAAYGLAGIVKGKGISILREARVLSTIRSAAENKKDVNERQGAFLTYELLSLILGRVFEPYVIQIVPQLLAGFGDTSADVRDACLDAAKTCFSSLSSYGVKQVLPTLLEGLDESQWRSKKGACDSLGAMAYLDPEQLAVSLPEIIPPLTEVLNDSHKEVRASANRSLQRFGEVISNPEVKSQVGILLKALSDPTKYTESALDALIKVNFVHYLDAPSLALVVRILERGLGDRSGTKRKASQIIGSLAHLTERKDLVAHLPILVAGLRVAIVDPVPATRATASKALGSTVEKLGEDALPDLIPGLMATLKSDTGAGDRLGSAQALSEVLAGLGTSRLEETLPSILQNVASSKASVREGFMSLFIFLPACFGNSFANYLSKVIPPILSGLADEVEAIRETSLRAGRLLVKNFATRSIDLLLPELERGLEDNSYRIRLSSVELVGDLLFNLTGITAKADQEDELEENATEAGASLLEVLGEEKRNKVLSALYICRNDTSGLVRTAAINVWKALVSTPRTLRELIPTLTGLVIRRLASDNMEQKVIAGNALGELIRKAGEGVLSTLLPTLEEGLRTSTDADARQGICIALRELVSASAPDALEDYEETLISVVRTALVDQDNDVREAAAEAFDSLQKILGKRAVDQVLPHLLNLLRSDDEAEHALSALLTLLTDTSRSNIILPNLLPTLLTPPISPFNARALASLSEVAGASMTRRLPTILNSMMDSITNCKDAELKEELETSFDTILTSVDEYDGLNTMMSVMLAMVKHDDHRKRASADHHLAKFFATTDVDFSRYYPDLIRAFLISFDDSDKDVVKAAWTALSALTSQLRKEEMESLVISTRTTLNQVGVAGHGLPGFSLPKGINAILPIFLQGLMNGSAEQRTQAALAMSDLVDRTAADALKPFVTQITGPLIRVVSERSTELKSAILLTLNNLLEKIPLFLKPFLPQLQRTFAKSLADPSSDVLRSRAAKALGTLIVMTPRIDPLITELVAGAKTPDAGVRNAMLKALYEVVSKAGSKMSDVSTNSILGLIDSDQDEHDDSMTITYAKLLGALIKVLPAEAATGLIKSRVVTNHFTHASVLALNAVLVESPESLTTGTFAEITPSIIVQGIASPQPFISDNCVLAAGKYLLTESSDKSFDATKPIFEALAQVIPPGHSVDTRRLALVVVRTVAREHNDVVRPHMPSIVPPVFASVRDMVIPVKLSAEAAFLAIFNVVDEEAEVFDKYMASPNAGGAMAPGPKRSMQEYFKRIALRLSSQARERKEAEGGAGGLGLSGDEIEDEKEVWSVGRMESGSGAFSDE